MRSPLTTPFSVACRLLAVGFLSLLLVGCGSNADQADSSSGKIQVVATTGPVGDLIRQLGGDLVVVDVMMGPGIDPHLYRAVPSDMKKLDKADLVVYNGLHLEGRLAEVLEGLAESKQGEGRGVIAVSDGLVEAHDARLISPEDYAGLHDPHIWHDVAIWSDCVSYVASELVKIDPSHAATYETNAKQYLSKLAELDVWCKAEFESIPEDRRMMVTAHDAFGYFSKAYGLESVGLKGVSTEDEVDLGQMTSVAAMLVERKVPCVFIESAVSPRIVEALVEACQAEGHTVRIGGELYADAMGAVGSGADDYIGMIRANVTTIKTGLLGEEVSSEESSNAESK